MYQITIPRRPGSFSFVIWNSC